MLTSRRVALGAGVVLLGGCGLMDALDKLKGITFTLPKQEYSVSTSNPGWRSPPPEGIPMLPCGQGQPLATCCIAGIDCTRTPLVCEVDRCALKFTYEQVKEVNLARDVPALKENAGMIFTDVLLKQLDLTVDNQMNVTTPPVDLYVAPTKVTSASSPGAQKFATIPMQAPGAKGPVAIPLDSNAQQIFSSFARATQTPFNIILSTGILVKSGDPVPMGKIDFTVSGTVEARL